MDGRRAGRLARILASGGFMIGVALMEGGAAHTLKAGEGFDICLFSAADQLTSCEY